MRKFRTEPLIDIVRWLEEQIQNNTVPGAVIEFIIPYTESKENDIGQWHNYPLRVWPDLADYINCRFLLPERIDGEHVCIRLQKIDVAKEWHKKQSGDKTEKYGTASEYFQIEKLHEPCFLLDYLRALHFVKIKPEWRILNLGVNRGDEFETIKHAVSDDCFSSLQFVGIDHSVSAIQFAKSRFPGKNFIFHCADINQLEKFAMERFNLVISIGTLQSPGIDREKIVRLLVQNHCRDSSAVLFAFPNCRYQDGELKYGAVLKNYAEPELSLLFKDVMFFKKYLQQHKFKVSVFGKYYIFIVGVR